ncbi:rplX [Symbiodinium pilosum]|uniref:Large ribosomal subunit protein uL24c n=1 Tax=Symbiodinium pilosum TaxID=2952 RepID=A0A812M0F3_SYMPI|nr:rplX [Symbiodinium pilosum]
MLAPSLQRRTPSQTGACSRVIMHARSPKPTTPAGSPKNKRRMRAGRKRPIFNGRQIAVRVNPKTNKPVRYKMHVMPGDTVQVMKGKDKGKVTEVLRIFPKWNKILCLGVNYCIKHVRPMREDEVGQRVQVEAPMHSSWVMHYDEEEEVAGLLGVRFKKKALKDGSEVVKKVRYNKSTGNEIPVRAPSRWVPVLDRVEDED